MINPDICFFHIEKCIGSSLRIILYEYFKNIYDEKLIYLPSKNNEQNLDNEEALIYFDNYKVILCHCNFNHKCVTDFFSKNCFSITCVRNPIDRILSHYYYFDYHVTNKKLYELSEEETKNIIREHGKTILMRLSGKTFILNDAKENLKYINCILIFEKFSDDLIKLNNLLNNKYNSDIVIENMKINEKIINFDEFKYKDIEIINKNINLIEDIELYNYILNMNDSERFKL